MYYGSVVDFVCGSGFNENYIGEFVSGGTTMNTPGVDVHLEHPRHKQPHIKHDGFCDSRQVWDIGAHSLEEPYRTGTCTVRHVTTSDKSRQVRSLLRNNDYN